MRLVVLASVTVVLTTLTSYHARASEKQRPRPAPGLATAYDTALRSRLPSKFTGPQPDNPVRDGHAAQPMPGSRGKPSLPNAEARPARRAGFGQAEDRDLASIDAAQGTQTRWLVGGGGLMLRGSGRVAAADTMEASESGRSSADRARNIYGALRLIPGLSNVDDISRTPSAPIALLDDKVEATGAIGLALGYDWRRLFGLPIRIEIEYHYRHHIDEETRTTNNIIYDASTKASQTIGVNIWVPWRILEDLDVLIGAGAGITLHYTKTKRLNPMFQITDREGTYTESFSWLAGLGIDYRFAPAWSVEAVYRYVELGKIETGTFLTGDSVTFGRNYSHDLALGLVYHF